MTTDKLYGYNKDVYITIYNNLLENNPKRNLCW